MVEFLSEITNFCETQPLLPEIFQFKFAAVSPPRYPDAASSLRASAPLAPPSWWIAAPPPARRSHLARQA
jgi:hypothetical protein